MENKANDMKNQFQSLTQDNTFMDAVGQLPQFVDDNNADCDMAYDWVCEMLNISSFVDNKSAWDSFYDAWDSTQGLDD